MWAATLTFSWDLGWKKKNGFRTGDLKKKKHSDACQQTLHWTDFYHLPHQHGGFDSKFEACCFYMRVQWNKHVLNSHSGTSAHNTRQARSCEGGKHLRWRQTWTDHYVLAKRQVFPKTSSSPSYSKFNSTHRLNHKWVHAECGPAEPVTVNKIQLWFRRPRLSLSDRVQPLYRQAEG